MLGVRVAPDEVLDQLAARAHVPVGGGALVGAAGEVAARHEPVVSTSGRQVPARWQRGLVEHAGAARVSEHLAAEQHAHVAGRAADVDARVGVLRVAEELLGLREPLVERVPAERDQALEEAGRRLGVRPGRARHLAVADRERVPGKLAARARLALAGLREQVGPDLGRGEVVDGQAAGLVQEQRVRAVDDGLAGGDAPDPRLDALDEQHPLRHRHVEAPGGALAQRPAACGQRHAPEVSGPTGAPTRCARRARPRRR